MLSNNIIISQLPLNIITSRKHLRVKMTPLNLYLYIEKIIKLSGGQVKKFNNANNHYIPKSLDLKI